MNNCTNEDERDDAHCAGDHGGVHGVGDVGDDHGVGDVCDGGDYVGDVSDGDECDLFGHNVC